MRAATIGEPGTAVDTIRAAAGGRRGIRVDRLGTIHAHRLQHDAVGARRIRHRAAAVDGQVLRRRGEQRRAHAHHLLQFGHGLECRVLGAPGQPRRRGVGVFGAACGLGQAVLVAPVEDRAGQAPVYYLEDNRYDPAVQLEDADWEADSTERLMVAMERLDARSKDILTRRWLAEDKATLHELAAEYGVSAERIRQLEKNAMEKIKAVLVA